MTQKRQFFKNLGINGINFVVNIMLGLLMTPFLINQLGISAFGIVQVAISTAAYVAMLSSSLNQANNRFISINVVAGNHQATTSVLSTIFILYGLSFLVILPILLYISFNLENIFNIDEHLVSSASYMFLFIGFSQILVMLTTAFMGPLYAKNRLDIIQSINILRNLLKLIFVFVFILYVSSSLSSIGEAFFLAALASTTVAMVIFNRFTPYYKFKFLDFDKNRAKEIFTLSGWTGVSVIGMLIFLQTDVILINIFLGAEESGRYAVLIQWSTLLIAVSIILSVVISPNILILYSKNKFGELKEWLYKSIRYQGIYSAIPVTMVVIYADTILGLWLGLDYVDLAPYLQLMIFHFAISMSIRQLYTVNTAYNKVKSQGIATLIFGLLHVTLSIILLKFTTLGILGVILSGVFFNIVLNIVFLPIYISNYLNEPSIKIYRSLIPVIGTQLIVLFFGYLFRLWFEPNSWITLILVSISTVIVVLLALYTIILNLEEQVEVKKLLVKIFR